MPQSLQGLLIPIAFLALMYFMLIRPQQVQQRKRQELLRNLKRNDKVVTIGGLHGQIVDLNDETVTLRVAKELELTFNRGSIAAVRGDG